MDDKLERTGLIETVLGIALDILPVVCAVLIVGWAGTAYAEGYGLFVQKGMDRPGEAHSELVEITEEEAASALKAGAVLERQKLIRSRFAFAIKARLSGYDGKILPGKYILSSDMTAEQMLKKISVEPGTEGERGEQGKDAGTEKDAGSGGPEKKENKDVWGQ